MNNFINIDSRSAGSGKTTGRKKDGTIGYGIYPQLKELYDQGQNTLVVVPSIQLQKQYLRDNPDLPITLISHDPSRESVSKRIIKALSDKERIVIITHEAFVLTEISWNIKTDYHLKFDEVVNPYSSLEISLALRNNCNIDLRLDELFEISQSIIDGWKAEEDPHSVTDEEIQFKRWAPIHRKPITEYNLLEESKTWRTLTNPNTRLWINKENWRKIQSKSIEKIYICSELDIKTFQAWRSVSISAAAFEYTFMCNWALANGMKVVTQKGCEFIPHKKVPLIHTPVYDDFRWSKNTKNQAPEILDDFYSYIEKDLEGGSCLVVRNNDAENSLANEEHINHNVHGMNNMQGFNAVCLSTAINPSPMFKDFLKEQHAFAEEFDKVDHHIARSFVAYTFYQILMRSSLRNQASTEQVKVFVLDIKIMYALLDFFDITELTPEDYVKTFTLDTIDEFLMIKQKDKDRKKAEKPRAMTSTERYQKFKERIRLENAKKIDPTFKDVPGYEGVYMMNDAGVLRRYLKDLSSKDKQLDLTTSRQVALSKDGVKTWFKPRDLYNLVFGE